MIRHGESEGNKRKIIQGPEVDYVLTEAGIDYIKKMVKENLIILSQCDRIISSPLKRTLQTSKVLQDETKLPIFTNSLLTEFNPGILGGKTHNECKENYPEYYKIWCDRKDLDGIPEAENGKQLQARVISFLINYADKEAYNDIIVSHAGFLRCLINTVKGVDRNTPVEIYNGVIHIFENPLDNLCIEKKLRAMTSKVYIVSTYNGKYVLKRKARPISERDIEEKRILDELSNKIHSLPIIIGLFNDEDGSSKVMEYINGKHIYGRLTMQQEIAVLKSFIIVRNNLIKVLPGSYEKVDLIRDIEHMKSNCKREYTRKYAQKILTDHKNINKLAVSEYSLCHNDLNRDNILFDQDDEGNSTVHFIDWEGIELCPKVYQLATFLTSSFLIEGYKTEEVMKFAKMVEPDIDENFLSFLMQIRVFKGLYFFAEFQNSFSQSNIEVSNEVLNKYYCAAEGLSKYREVNNFDMDNSRNNSMNFERS